MRAIICKFAIRMLLVVIGFTLFAGNTFAQKKIMPLGNSITRGVDGPSTDNAGYRNDLWALLQAEGVSVDFVGSLSDGTGFDSDHEGHDGFRADDILANINSYLSGADPDVIILHIGTNDVSNNDTAQSTRNEIGNIIDAIHNANPNTKIILSSIIPRNDGKDPQTTSLNRLIEDLFYTKRDNEGRNLYYAGVNEIYKQNANWATDYFEVSDDVHPNDAGYNVMGEVYFNAVMVALNSSNTNISDNFERTNLGITWAADTEFALQNGELVNTATSGPSNWKYMSTFRSVKNPSSVSLKWGASADASGINEGGLALLLDAPSRNASGYLAWITTGDNKIRLWTIDAGKTGNDLNVEQVSQASTPGAGDIMRVDLTIDGSNLQFDYYVNNAVAGNITIPNPGGLAAELYSGVLLKHNLNNNIDEFTVKKSSDTVPPDPVSNLSIAIPTATSVSLTWTATGDDGSTGQASSYDLRYDTQLIDNTNFNAATKVAGVPGPAPSGSLENYTVSGLQTGLQYYFAIKVIDGAGNTSTLSNVATATTITGNFFIDDFERATLGPDWTTDPDYAIVNGRLSNTSTFGVWNELAILNAHKNPSEISFTWAVDVDATGIDQGGFVLVFGSASNTSNGYAVTRRTGSNNEIRLWEIIGGTVTSVIQKNQSPNLTPPTAGDVVKIVISSSAVSNKFEFYRNNLFDGFVEDTGFRYDLTQDRWGGVVLNSNNNNNIEDFTIQKTPDTNPPDPVINLSVGTPTATSIPLTWTATGDDGSTGQASSYDLRYDTQIINNTNFDAATQVVGVPAPAVSGSTENFTVAGLQPGTQLYFALKVIDEAGNSSTLSNVVITATVAGNFFVDDFERATLGANWTAASDYAIVNGRLSNTSVSSAWNELAILSAKKNPNELFFTWADDADAVGIDQGGFALVFGSAGATSSGYAIARRTGSNNEIRLWEIVNGKVTSVIDKNQSPNLTPPIAGDVIKVVISSSGFSNKFEFYKNNQFDGSVEDSGFLYDLSQDNWGGVTLNGNFNNDIEDFTVLLQVGAAANMVAIAGDAQSGKVGQQLPIPLTVRVTDNSGNAVSGFNINFEVLAGGGSVDVAPPITEIVVEAESGALTSPMASGNDGSASGGSFIYVPDGAGGLNQGQVQYTIQITDAGNYIMWGRAIYPNANADAFGVIMDGISYNWDVGQRNHQSVWHWDEVSHRGTGSANNPQLNPVIFNLTAGQHTLIIKEIKDGTKLDQFVIAKQSSGFQPPGNQSAISPGGTNTNSSGEASTILTLGPTPGINQVRAFGNGLSDVIFSATGTAGTVASIIKLSGDGQIGNSGQVLPLPFVVEVKDAFGNPAIGTITTWTILGGANGSLSAGTQAVVNASGQASNTLTLATNMGLNQVKVTTSGYVGPDVIFTATPIPGAAATIALVSGNSQTGTGSTPLAAPFIVQVVDNIGTPVPGQDVQFKVIAGGGNFNGISEVTIQTGADGTAAATMILGPAPDATNQAQAIVNGLSGSPVTFSATSVKPQLLNPVSALVHSGIASVPLSDSIKVLVKDALNNPLPNFPVEFSVTLGGGSVNESTSPVTVSTGTDGIAKVMWRLGPNAGSANNKLMAKSTFNNINLAGSPIEFTASAAVGDASNLVEVSGNNQSGLVDTILDLPFVVKVTDASDNVVVGWPVTFSIQEGGGTFNGQTTRIESTDNNGYAQTTLTLGSNAGTPSNPFNNKVQVSAENNNQNLSGSPINFQASAIATGARDLILVGGNNQTGKAGQALAQQIRVKVTDGPNANPIANHSVTFKSIAGGGTFNGTALSEIQILTNASGIAAVSWYLGGALGTNNQSIEVRADDGINDLTNSPMNIQATAEAGPVDPNASTVVSDVAAVEADGVAKANITITLTDKFGNPISQRAVTIISSGSQNDITQPIDATNAEGKVFGNISSTKAEIKTISARDILNGITLNSSINVTFISQPPDRVTLNGGNNQSANIGTSVPQPIEVLVSDTFNNPVPGVVVEFEVLSGGGRIAQTSSPGSNSPQSPGANKTTTDANGKASSIWVLGSSVGVNTARARAFFNGSELSGSPVIFTAQGLTASATNMSLFDGNNQQGLAGLTLGDPLSVLVTDSQGRPVAGVVINFNVQLGGGSLSNTSPKSNFAGIAKTAFTLGQNAGTNIVEASNNQLAGSQIQFTFEGLVGPPAKFVRYNGHNETALVNSLHSIGVLVTDFFNNPRAGVNVAFKVIQGNASIPIFDQITEADGIAGAKVLMPNIIEDVIISVNSSDMPGFFVLFTVHSSAGTARNLAEFSGNNQEGTVGKPLVKPLTVKVTDEFGNPVSGQEVQWVRTIGGGTVSPSTTRTDEKGMAWTEFTLGQAGNNEALAIASQLTPGQLKFTATGVNNNFPEFIALNDTNITEGNLLQFQVKATDADNDPLTFGAQNLPNGATFNASSATFNWTPNQVQQGEYQVTFVVSDNKGGLDSETINITVLNSNNPPVINSFTPAQFNDLFIVMGDIVHFSVNATDADAGDAIAYRWRISAEHIPGGQLLSTSPGFDFVTDNFEPATYTIQLEVTDGQDTVKLEWNLSLLIVSVELASFSGRFDGFDGAKINWVTSREINNVGFNILRSRRRDGKYTKINPELITASAEGDYSFIDKQVKAGLRYFYMLEDVNISGTKTLNGPIEIFVSAPERFELSQNYPNPFNPSTNIRFKLPKTGRVQLKIFDVLGREVRTLIDKKLEADYHVVTWNSRDNRGMPVSSGVYYYQVATPEFRETKKMLLLK